MILSWDKQSCAEGHLYPVSREGHSLTFIPGQGIFMFGGLGSNLFAELFFYDPEIHSWHLVNIKGRYPTPRCYHQAFYFETGESCFFAVYAGQGDRGRSLGDMYVLNLKDPKSEWKRVVTSKPPESRHQHSICGEEKNYTGTKYVFGGINSPNNTFFNDLWLLDFNSMIYEQGASEVSGVKFQQIQTLGCKPKARKGHCSFVYKGKLFVYGGQTKDMLEDTMRFLHFIDLEKLQWGRIENKSAEISSRSLFSFSWYNESTLIVS